MAVFCVFVLRPWLLETSAHAVLRASHAVASILQILATLGQMGCVECGDLLMINVGPPPCFGAREASPQALAVLVS